MAGITIDLNGEAMNVLHQYLTADEELAPLTLSVGDGHSGFGLYLHETECPDDGSVFLQSVDAPPATPAPAAPVAAFEEAMRQTWRMIDPLHPAGQPGSYARGQDAGIAAALKTLRENFERLLAAPPATPAAQPAEALPDVLPLEVAQRIGYEYHVRTYVVSEVATALRKLYAAPPAAQAGTLLPTEPLWDHKGNVRHEAVDRLRDAQRAAAQAGDAQEAIEAYLEAQDALDNRELQGPNAERHDVLMARRNRAREALAAALAARGQAVPDIDYDALIAHCSKKYRWTQGTPRCSAFALGAEWMRDQIAAAPAAPKGGAA